MGAGEIVVWRVGEATVPNAMDGAGVKANRFVELDPDPRGAVPLVTVDMVQPDKPEGQKERTIEHQARTGHVRELGRLWEGPAGGPHGGQKSTGRMDRKARD